MKSTRERILQTLLQNPRCTINKLAKAVEINAISVRHHLANLQADGLVTSEEERHGVGRPRLVYSLTDQGIEKFPTRYVALTNRLLDQLQATLPDSQIDEIFENIADSIVDEYKEEMAGLPLEGKLKKLREALTQEGYTLNWSKKGSQFHIVSTTCPYHHLSLNHPGMCLMDKVLISRLLSLPVERVKSIAEGEKTCQYIVVENPE
jgi:predicted ArsR family transcriptional regulator